MRQTWHCRVCLSLAGVGTAGGLWARLQAVSTQDTGLARSERVSVAGTAFAWSPPGGRALGPAQQAFSEALDQRSEWDRSRVLISAQVPEGRDGAS